MNILPSDLQGLFYNYLPVTDSCSLACTTRLGNFLYQEKTRSLRQAGNYILRPRQSEIRDFLATTESGNYLIQAPTSYGKTAIVLSLVFRDWAPDTPRTGPLYVAIVPPKAFLTWINEAMKMYGPGIYNKKTGDSPLIACLSICSPIHNNMYSSTANLATVLHPNTRLVLLSNKTCTSRHSTFIGSRVIVDEAHTCHQWKIFLGHPGYKWTLLMSASVIYTDISIDRKFVLGDKINSGRVPTAITYMYLVDGVGDESYKPIDIKFRDIDIPVYAQAVASSVLALKDSRRIVIFLPGGKIFKSIFPYIKAYMDQMNREVLVFTKSLNRIHQFESSSNPSVLLLSHELSESINIDAEAAICVRGDWVNTERFGQMISRILRITNPNKTVNIIQIAPSGFPQYKVNYAECCRLMGVHTSGEQISAGELIMAYRVIRAYGYDANTVTPADVVAICNQDHDPQNKKKLLTWWRTQKSVFTSAQQETILQ